MSQNLVTTDPGGEQTQYEGQYTEVAEPSKSGGQMGQPGTTSQYADSASAAKMQQGDHPSDSEPQTMKENINQAATTQTTEAKEGGFRPADQDEGNDAVGSRKAEGYGGSKDMNREIGA